MQKLDCSGLNVGMTRVNDGDKKNKNEFHSVLNHKKCRTVIQKSSKLQF